ncbi:hypothetical protein LCGC14_3094320, partial [marine sediment metagenome]
MIDSGSNNIPAVGNIFMGSTEVNPTSVHIGPWRGVLNRHADQLPLTMPRRGTAGDFYVLRVINDYVNMWPYISDESTGHRDIWRTPQEFLLNGGGDCEDQSIFNFFLARAAGFPSKDLRLILVKNMWSNVNHAICAAHTQDTWYILDNSREGFMQPAVAYKG